MRPERCDTGERDPPDHRSSGHLLWLSHLVQSLAFVIGALLDACSPDFIRVPAGGSARDHALRGVGWEGRRSGDVIGWMTQLSLRLSFVTHGLPRARDYSSSGRRVTATL